MLCECQIKPEGEDGEAAPSQGSHIHPQHGFTGRGGAMENTSPKLQMAKGTSARAHSLLSKAFGFYAAQSLSAPGKL